MTLKEANRKWMDIGGAAGMVIAAGTEELVSVGWGVGDGVGDGKGNDEGGLAGTAPGESATTGNAGGTGGLVRGGAGSSSSGAGSNKGDEAVDDVWERDDEDGNNGSGKAVQDRGERRS
jgi:hypothetical protein